MIIKTSLIRQVHPIYLCKQMELNVAISIINSGSGTVAL